VNEPIIIPCRLILDFGAGDEERDNGHAVITTETQSQILAPLAARVAVLEAREVIVASEHAAAAPGCKIYGFGTTLDAAVTDLKSAKIDLEQFATTIDDRVHTLEQIVLPVPAPVDAGPAAIPDEAMSRNPRDYGMPPPLTITHKPSTPPADDAENWRVVPSHPKFEASTLGRLRNAETKVVYNPSKGKYQRVTVRRNGKSENKLIHRLVAEAFHGPCPDKMECDHIDRNTQNNKPSNLRWVTRATNNLNRADMSGHASKSAKLDERGKAAAIAMYAAGISQRKIAQVFNVSQSCIYLMLKGEHYPASSATVDARTP
jgi:hypothetical protein